MERTVFFSSLILSESHGLVEKTVDLGVRRPHLPLTNWVTLGKSLPILVSQSLYPLTLTAWLR